MTTNGKISRELYLEWRSPRIGTGNPSVMNNPVWESLIQSGESAYRANDRYSGPSSHDAGPSWCFNRFGQSATTLADGREILVAGEHEDHYDPDFHIYNDVVVKHPDGRIDIYGNPKDVFPPTDFHSATLVAGKIVLIGSLGYDAQRQIGVTQVLVLDLADFSVRRIETGGPQPGWIHGHEAFLALDRSAIRITKGLIEISPDKSFAENSDDWTLSLDTWNWVRSEARPWTSWTVLREDKKYSRLWNIRHLLWLRDLKNDKHFSGQFEEGMLQLTAEMGRAPAIDVVPTLYQPPVTHEQVPEVEEEHRVFRIVVDGVIVRYVEEMHAIRVVVEGELPSSTLQILQADLLEKLRDIENTPWVFEY